jgi:tetratricopeptide (TPR) repeat protein
MGEGADNLSTASTPRMRQLRLMLERQPDDPFLLYGLAMEYKKADEPARALEYFDQVLRRDPNYCYAYYQRAQVHESQGDVDAARRTLREGIEAAKRSGDDHALSEIEAALALLE